MDADKFSKLEAIKQAAAAGKLDVNEAIDLVHFVAEDDGEPKRLRVRFYLSKLGTEELHDLSEFTQRIRRSSALLADWLDGVVKQEVGRRDSLDSDTPLEIEQPDATAWLTWTNAEVADALKAATVVTFATMPKAVGDFIDKLNTSVVGLACNRLRRNST